jgi:hypothetical protein
LKVLNTDKKRQPRTFCPGLALFMEKWNNLRKNSQGSKEGRPGCTPDKPLFHAIFKTGGKEKREDSLDAASPSSHPPNPLHYHPEESRRIATFCNARNAEKFRPWKNIFYPRKPPGNARIRRL